MERIRLFLRGQMQSFFYFYKYIGKRILLAILLSLLVGVLDGVGLTMFLPLLQMIDGGGKLDSESMGNLSFVIDLFSLMGIGLSVSVILVSMIFFFILKGVVKFVEGYYRVILEQRFIRQIRFANIDLLAGFNFKDFVESDPGRIQNTFGSEIEKVLLAYRTYFTAVQYGVLVGVYIFLAFLANPQFAILVAIGGGLTNLIFSRIYKKTKKMSRELTGEGHKFQGFLIQNVTYFKYLKATGLIFNYAKKLKESSIVMENKQRKLGIMASMLAGMREPLIIVVVVSVVILQIAFFNKTLGLIILSLLFFYRSLSFLMALQSYWNTYLSVSGSLENVSAFTKELSLAQESKGGKPYNTFNRTISVKNLFLKYGEKVVLQDISFTIAKNEVVALVGESGSGKTSLLNVLAGLLPVEPNIYFLDEIDFYSIDKRNFKNRIGYITQEPVIFNDTIFNNVTFWAEPNDVNKDKFYKALEMASIQSFVAGLADAENTILGHSGLNISGGQKQRLSIARELFKEVDILFMDEATSALDSETESEIQENLDKLKGKLTIVIVAHRLATIKNADKIIYMNDGRIINIGNLETLRNLSPDFNRILELQRL